MDEQTEEVREFHDKWENLRRTAFISRVRDHDDHGFRQALAGLERAQSWMEKREVQKDPWQAIGLAVLELKDEECSRAEGYELLTFLDVVIKLLYAKVAGRVLPFREGERWENWEG